MAEKTLYTRLEKRYQAAIEDHRHAVGIISDKNVLITKLRGMNAAALRQNRRLSRESQELANRLKEVSPGDSKLIDLLFPKD